MSLSDTSIRRPVLAIVMSLIIVLFGATGFYFLGVREYPAVDPPIVTVQTTYPGANPDVVASQITEPLEQVINGIAGIRTLSSESRQERSTITVEFTLDSDLDTAANDVRDRVSRAARNLPVDSNPPVVEKADADSSPILFLSMVSDKRGILEVSDIADRVVRERMETIPGVSSVRIFGEKRYAMRLWMDPVKLAVHRLTPADVQAALDTQNVDLPSGRLEGSSNELSLRTLGRLSTPQEFENLIIKQENGRQILFGDIGYAELGPENLRTGFKNGQLYRIGVAIIPQPNTNAIAIADEFNKRLEQVRKEVPPDITVEVGYDFTRFVRRSVAEVEETLVIAFVLVALIIFLFLRDWRSTIIPVIAIPVSIIAAFFIMYLAGFSINVLTLVAIVLAIGLVCDDAIVVLENIYTKIEEGMTPMEAALTGSKEIYFAVISTTFSLAAVFLPLIFLSGLTGRLFREFGITLAGSVLVSAFVALTLSPMMCRFLLKKHGDTPNWFYRTTEPFFRGLTSGYRGMLGPFLRWRWLAFPILLASGGMIAWLVGVIPQELAPLEDRENIRVNVTAPEGAGFEYTESWMDKIAAYVDENIPETYRSFTILGGGGGGSEANSGAQNIYLKAPEERGRTQDQIAEQLTRELQDFTGVRSFASQPPTIGDRRAGQPLAYVIQAPNFESLVKVLPEFLAEANKSPLLRQIDANLKVNRPEGVISIDRKKAAELGISVEEIGKTVEFAYSGRRFGYFLKNGKQYQVIAQMQRQDRNDPGDLKKLFVRTAKGEMVSLDNLVSFSESASPAAIFRFNRAVSATIQGTPAPGHTLGDGIKELDKVAEKVLPENFRTSLAGQSRDFAESSSSLLFAFVLALLIIYLVLAAQFESFRDPFIIILTVPLSVAGALLSLHLTDQTLNVFSQIGIIMLIGIVTKNGILIVEFANQRKEAGLSKTEAALEAAISRFRPILMTSLATIFGILPIALSLGASGGSRQSLGIAVVGGLIFSGFLTLFVVPAVYAIFSRAAVKHE
ncbi:efflux RND transporter permease subunit [Luteolibacter yonseiensis]|uniref:Efflux RND transporter permease subunit n=1 Tax=Luteolibacter yonseiensis TaxID=1144680 RepID=A0A934R1L6_9BACT|nr:efflux RND transporter permease subunit [Luteolibacter yonseiensis]MBK1815276.1 efflux RND transporter permease subunit [Luteolibacter yonseiensis]